jgi:regulator of sigma E protease
MSSAIIFNVIVGVLVLGLLIFVHELGHFLFAKLFKVGVLEFAIGFGKKIVTWRRGETRYSIGLIPLGGYVRMVGDDPRSLEAGKADQSGPGFDIQEIGDLTEEQKAMINDRSRWLQEKGFWPKFWIVFAGPLFNLVFAWILAVALFATYGADKPVTAARMGELFPDHPAEKAGLKRGDLITKINGEEIKNWKDFSKKVRKSDGSQLNMQLVREVDGNVQTKEITVTPELESTEMALLSNSTKPTYVIGVQPLFEPEKVTLKQAFIMGSFHVVGVSVLSLKSLYWLVKGAVSPKNIGGPISIVKAAGKSAERGLERLVLFIIFLSVSLAVLNLLPIPVLDGGHIMFFTIEALLGKKLSLNIQERATQVGMAMLLCLMIFAIGNDIVQLFN